MQRCLLTLFVAAGCLSLAIVRAAAGSETPPAKEADVQILTTKTGIRFGVWPGFPPQPAPTLFVLAGTIEGTLGHAYYRQSGNDLAPLGYLCVSVDLPCHGRDRRPDEPEGLNGWRHRCDRNEDFIDDLNHRLCGVLDHLIEARLADPERVAACGTSRGGFAALHFAAADPRVKCVAAFAPVTDLGALSEFRGAEHQPPVMRLAVERRAEELAGRAVWLVIGDRDERVGTDHTIRLARQLTAASLKNQRDALVDLHVVSEPKGHTTPTGAAEQAAKWIEQQMHRMK
jgi:pimeloyl-ACP methyl ester carboxylesterase